VGRPRWPAVVLRADILPLSSGGRAVPKTAGRLGPIREADALGIDVCTAGMDSGVSGTLEKERGSDPTIYLNRTRQREPTAVTCAHELGHYVRRDV
jgi:hypothetical protein